MEDEKAVSEIIGALLLMGIIVAAFAIFGVLYLPTIKPPELPKVQLSMACSDRVDDNTIEFPCTLGMNPCKPFDNLTCENDCKFRGYSQNPQFNPVDLQREIYRCLGNCLSPICSDLGLCRFLYICHNGGDSLQIDSLLIKVNGNEIDQSNWEMKTSPVQNFKSCEMNNCNSDQFKIGSTIRIRNTLGHLESVIIIYTPPFGGEYTMLMNNYGTAIN